MVENYKDLDVWQLSMELVDNVYRITDSFPQKEQYRLTGQLCRAVISIPSNIAKAIGGILQRNIFVLWGLPKVLWRKSKPRLLLLSD